MTHPRAGSTVAPSVALVTMPFAVVAMPTIGVATLKAVLTEAGVSSRVYDFNLEYLPWIARELDHAAALHDEISYLWDFQPGEWLFSPQADARTDAEYLNLLASRAGVSPQVVDLLRRLRRDACRFADSCASVLAAEGHDIVGFTSSFMQTQPSMAVARRLKELRPQVRIVFGGSNAFGEMGRAILEQFRCLDVVVHGEAEAIIVPLIRALRGEPGHSLGDIGNISYLDAGVITGELGGDAPVVMDAVPVPDYSDYFATLKRLAREHGPVGLPRFVPLETARGCWWGEKSHCTFCGLNADRMQFRSRSCASAVAVFEELFRRHGIPRFFLVDNILDHRYFDTVLPQLARQPTRFFIHSEIKANLRRRNVEALVAAGVTKVQPGIESLSTSILARMRKGITAIQNVQTLKWLTELSFQTSWYLLYGFPGESVDSYRQIAALLPRLSHLVPPIELAPVHIERFSPYHTQPAAFGIAIGAATSWYHWAFPGVPEERLNRLAYRFEFSEPARDPEVLPFVQDRLRPLVQQWQQKYAHHHCTLGIVHGPTESVVVCGPLTDPERLVRLGPEMSRVLRRTASIQQERTVLGAADTTTASADDEEQYRRFLRTHDRLITVQGDRQPRSSPALIDDLVDSGLLMREGDRLLALPVDWTRTALPLLAAERELAAVPT